MHEFSKVNNNYREYFKEFQKSPYNSHVFISYKDDDDIRNFYCIPFIFSHCIIILILRIS